MHRSAVGSIPDARGQEPACLPSPLTPVREAAIQILWVTSSSSRLLRVKGEPLARVYTDIQANRRRKRYRAEILSRISSRARAAEEMISPGRGAELTESVREKRSEIFII